MTERSPGQINDAILAVEDKLGLLDMQVGDIELWATLRFRIGRQLQAASTTLSGQMNSLHSRFKRQLKTLPWDAPRDMLEHLRLGPNPRADVLVFAHPRLVQIDGQRVCRYSHPLLGSSSVNAETEAEPFRYQTLMPTNQGQRYRDDGPSVYWPELDLLRALPRSRPKQALAYLRRGHRQIGDAVTALEQALDVQVSRQKTLRHALLYLAMDAFWTPFFERLLDRVQPRVVVELVHYSELCFILSRVCHSRGIPVLELQHGTLGPTHLAYRARGPRRQCWPDAFLTWGQLWNASTPDLFLPPKRTPAIGYAYLEAETKRTQAVPPKRKTLLVLSQWILGEAMTRFTISAAVALSKDHWHVRYRLHPNERFGWQERYPDLVRSDVEVIDGDHSVYQDQAQATAQLGVSSTALIEGLAWGLPTFIARLDSWQGMQWLLDAGVAHCVDDVDDLVTKLKSLRDLHPSPKQVEAIWPTGARRNFHAVLRGAMNGAFDSP